MRLMEYVDKVLCSMGGEEARLYETDQELKTAALQHDLHLLGAKVRHLGTDRNVRILEKMYDAIRDSNVEMKFYTAMDKVEKLDNGKFHVKTSDGEEYVCRFLVLAAGRSGSTWISSVCDRFGIKQTKNRVDIGVRVELPAEIFKHITDEVYESKIVYKTDKYNDMVRTFCMNPYGEVVSENTNGIVTVNGHSYACLLYTSYVAGEVFKHLKATGGIEAMEKRNREKAALLYDYIDSSSLYKNPVAPEDRSMMNVVFVTGNPDLDKKFVAEAKAAGFINLGGHRSIGGMRASIYNAMPREGVEALIEFMKKFEEENR